ncbi:aminotransferase class V-fold PLP-dependent enzyme [Ruegeria sp. 2012CJ41-6]|uniref:Aminotransferase class V-fold PLP-dependent enzyme n=1 Tax=Ruegeria spongiae TaxID=2942209 RepID=A0ABT0Q6X7_9RHOB|nr:aminotransferase class V-fold PLP-dependent enzyme [Ruegeria spongiae]MCL6285590.1 aminotransferase class V-fold PLP-dependent enzyme [Ruegeria spongiae]
MARIRNFTPGPVEVSEKVLAAQYGSQGLHVGPEFSQAYVRATRNLQPVFGTDGYVAIVPGCGTLANEMAVRALLDEGQTALILDAGYFSNVLRKSVEGCGGIAVLLPVEPGRPADPDQLRSALGQQQIDLVCFTHVETSTGLLNPVEALAKVASEAGVPVLVDSVSGLGTAASHMDDWGVTIMTSGSQKGLGSVPGLGLVAVSDAAWPRIAQKKSPRGGFTDIRRWKEQLEAAPDWHPSLTTMPVGVVHALDVALLEMQTEGLETRYARHEDARAFLCDAMEGVGLELQIEEGSRSPGVTGVKTSGAFRSSDLVRYLIEYHQIRIAGGFGANKEEVFRVAHMGDNACRAALRPVIAGVKAFLD